MSNLFLMKMIRDVLTTAAASSVNEPHEKANEVLRTAIREAVKITRAVEPAQGEWPNTTQRLAPPKDMDELIARFRVYMEWLDRRSYDELAEEVRCLIEGHDPDDECDVYGNLLCDCLPGKKV